jgi:hypothetical protein
MPKSRSSRRSRRGISRLEIVSCLIVVCILMTLLLQRMSTLRASADAARLRASVDSVQLAATLFHVRCETSGGGECASLAFEGHGVQGVHGWPAATRGGIGLAASLPPDFTLRPDGRAMRIALGRGHCEFLYAEAASLGASPVVDIVDVSCH